MKRNKKDSHSAARSSRREEAHFCLRVDSGASTRVSLLTGVLPNSPFFGSHLVDGNSGHIAYHSCRGSGAFPNLQQSPTRSPTAQNLASRPQIDRNSVRPNWATTASTAALAGLSV